MVPGLRAELVQATIRTLPKPLRVQLVPAPDVARAVDGWMSQHLATWEDTVRAADAAPSFHEAFASAVRALRAVDVPPDAFDDARLPAHLRVTFRVIDAGGGIVDEGKDLLALQRRLVARSDEAVASAVRTAVRAAMDEARAAATPQAPAAVSPGQGPHRGTPVTPGATDAPHEDGESRTPPDEHVPTELERSGLTTWPDDLTLPLVVETRSRGVAVKAYPALVDLTTSEKAGAAAPRRSDAAPKVPGPVGVRVLGSPASAEAAHRAGLRRLLLADVGLGTARITTRWSGTQALALASSPYPTTEALVTDVQLAAIETLVPDPAAVRDRDSYDKVRAEVRDRLEDEVHRLVGTLVEVLTAWREADSAVRSSSSLALVAAARDEPAPRRRPRGAGPRGRRRVRRGRRARRHGRTRPGARRHPRRRPLAARGAPRLAVRAAPGHAGEGLDHPHQQGARRALIRPSAARRAAPPHGRRAGSRGTTRARSTGGRGAARRARSAPSRSPA
jgi:ATP-dependent helicase HrpA